MANMVQCVANRHLASNGIVDPDVVVGGVYMVIERDVASMCGEFMVVRDPDGGGADLTKPKYFFEPLSARFRPDLSMLIALNSLLDSIKDNPKTPAIVKTRTLNLAMAMCRRRSEG